MAAGITVAVEGTSDEEVARRIAEAIGLKVHRVYPSGGKEQLDKKLSGYNNAARYSPWLVLRDLDREECAPTLVRRLVPQPSPQLLLRIPVRSAEAWLMAHRGAMAQFLGVRISQIPEDPESLDNAKQFLVNLARKSRRRAVRLDMVPPDGFSSLVGPGYTSRITEFVSRHWDPEIAAESSPSLRGCLGALATLVAQQD